MIHTSRLDGDDDGLHICDERCGKIRSFENAHGLEVHVARMHRAGFEGDGRGQSAASKAVRPVAPRQIVAPLDARSSVDMPIPAMLRPLLAGGGEWVDLGRRGDGPGARRPRPVRLRHDSWHYAGHHRAIYLGALDTSGWATDWRAEVLSVPMALAGDVWPGPRWSTVDPTVITGYVLTCPVLTCPVGVHPWTHAYTCERHKGHDRPCKFGDRPGQDSCWVWTGRPEDGTLTATPSLHVPLDLGGCGFHGFLTNGVLA